jgi:hypothetical protein
VHPDTTDRLVLFDSVGKMLHFILQIWVLTCMGRHWSMTQHVPQSYTKVENHEQSFHGNSYGCPEGYKVPACMMGLLRRAAQKCPCTRHYVKLLGRCHVHMSWPDLTSAGPSPA